MYSHVCIRLCHCTLNYRTIFDRLYTLSHVRTARLKDLQATPIYQKAAFVVLVQNSESLYGIRLLHDFHSSTYLETSDSIYICCVACIQCAK